MPIQNTNINMVKKGLALHLENLKLVLPSSILAAQQFLATLPYKIESTLLPYSI